MKKPNFFLRVGKGLIKNIELKIVAVLFACLLWLFAVNIADPVGSQPFHNIPVTIINEDIITNQGKMHQILYGTESVSVIIRAPRSVMEQIRNENIIATADISQMELNTLVPITVTVQGIVGTIESAVANPTNLQVLIEDVERRTLPIAIFVVGEPADGYVVGETTATPDTITIRGPETLVNSIDRVELRASVTGLSYSQSLPGELIIFDEYGDRINPALFSGLIDAETVYYVNVEMLETELVPVVIEEPENVPEGYVVSNISSEPGYVLVAGTRRDLQHLREIVITSDAFDLDDDVGIYSIPVDVRPHLPVGIILADETANLIVVNLAIERAGTRTIELIVDTISIEGLAEGLTISFEPNGEISIVVSGQRRILDGLDLRNAVSIDLTQHISPGSFIVPVQVELPSHVTLLRGATVRITLEEVEEEDENVD